MGAEEAMREGRRAGRWGIVLAVVMTATILVADCAPQDAAPGPSPTPAVSGR